MPITLKDRLDLEEIFPKSKGIDARLWQRQVD
jgi:hypothetical protein